VNPQGKLEWNIDHIASSLLISKNDVRIYFTDGRRVSFLLERRIAYEVFQGRLASSEGAGYDLIDRQGDKWEVRSISKGGIYFCPSYMVGKGRSFDEDGFLAKLNEIRGYVVSDIEQFPSIPYWIIPGDIIENWWKVGQIGNTNNITRKKALDLIGML
jgi:hypothetical protein